MKRYCANTSSLPEIVWSSSAKCNVVYGLIDIASRTSYVIRFVIERVSKWVIDMVIVHQLDMRTRTIPQIYDYVTRNVAD